MREDLARAGAQCVRIVPRAAVTRAMGWLSERPIPGPLRAPVLGGLARFFGMDVTEAEYPLERYGSFQELFCRRLAAGSRPCLGSDGAIVSPVDGRFVCSGTVDSDATFMVKGLSYGLRTLLGGGPVEAEPFIGGTYGVFYLSPKDYHRMHSPVTGRVVRYRWQVGELWPVNALVPYLPDVYCDNERIITWIDTTAGQVAMVKVAAMGVGYISLSYLGEPPGVRLPQDARARSRVFDPRDAPEVRMGDEIASFGMGSTVLLLFEPGRWRLDLSGDGQVVRVGERIGEQVTL